MDLPDRKVTVGKPCSPHPLCADGGLAGCQGEAVGKKCAPISHIQRTCWGEAVGRQCSPYALYTSRRLAGSKEVMQPSTPCTCAGPAGRGEAEGSGAAFLCASRGPVGRGNSKEAASASSPSPDPESTTHDTG